MVETDSVKQKLEMWSDERSLKLFSNFNVVPRANVRQTVVRICLSEESQGKAFERWVVVVAVGTAATQPQSPKAG